jgi:hypothetical protein
MDWPWGRERARRCDGVVQGMNAYGQHQAFVNDRWMAAYDALLEKKSRGAGKTRVKVPSLERLEMDVELEKF